jgi:hypothetical protein
MVLSLPPFNSTVNSDEKKTKKIYQNNIQYNPIYNNIYDLEPKIVKKTDRVEENLKKDIFDLNLLTIIKNISDAILLILIDLTNPNNYSNLSLFLNIFFKENRLIYLGIFIVIISVFFLLFK